MPNSIRDSYLKMFSIFDLYPLAVLVVKSDGTICFTNEITNQLLKYDSGELLGKKIECIVPESIRSQHEEMRNSYFKDPKVRTLGSGLDLYAECKDGSTVPVDISLAPVGVDFAISVIYDLSDRIKISEQLVANSQLNIVGLLASSLVHELANPLQVLDLLWKKSNKNNDIPKEESEKINQTIGLMKNLLNNYRSFITNTSNVLDEEVGHATVESAISMMETLCSSKLASIKYEIENNAPDSIVPIQTNQLAQVLVNLVMNAIDAMKDKKKSESHLNLNVSCKSSAHLGVHAQFLS